MAASPTAVEEAEQAADALLGSDQQDHRHGEPPDDLRPNRRAEGDHRGFAYRIAIVVGEQVLHDNSQTSPVTSITVLRGAAR